MKNFQSLVRAYGLSVPEMRQLCKADYVRISHSRQKLSSNEIEQFLNKKTTAEHMPEGLYFLRIFSKPRSQSSEKILTSIFSNQNGILTELNTQYRRINQ